MVVAREGERDGSRPRGRGEVVVVHEDEVVREDDASQLSTLPANCLQLSTYLDADDDGDDDDG